MERWSGRVAVITGACGGLGTTICKNLADCGVRVAGIDIAIPMDPDSRIKYHQCDLLQLDQIEAAFRWVDDQFGGVDILVNCAGYHTIGHITNILDNAVSDKAIINTMDLNIKAMIFCTRQAVDLMKRHGVDDGYIVNINSSGGHVTYNTTVCNVYNSSKFAVTAFTGSLINELREGDSNIRVTSISPGTVRTPMTEKFVPKWDRPHLLPQDVADAVLYVLATPQRVHIHEIVIQSTKALRT